MRLGIPEINQHAVAEVLGDKARIATDNFADAAVIGAEYLTQIFRIVARRQWCRADQIAEHYRELAPLRLAADRSGSGGRGFDNGFWCSPAKSGDRRQQFAAMPDRCDPEPGQIIGCQLGQYLAVDVI